MSETMELRHAENTYIQQRAKKEANTSNNASGSSLMQALCKHLHVQAFGSPKQSSQPDPDVRRVLSMSWAPQQPRHRPLPICRQAAHMDLEGYGECVTNRTACNVCACRKDLGSKCKPGRLDFRQCLNLSNSHHLRALHELCSVMFPWPGVLGVLLCQAQT